MSGIDVTIDTYRRHPGPFGRHACDRLPFNVSNGDPSGEGYEALIEIAYIVLVMDDWTLQGGFFQCILNPDGGVKADNANVVSARSTIAF